MQNILAMIQYIVYNLKNLLLISFIFAPLQPGSVWIPSGDKCVKYECVKIQEQFIPIEAKTVCPVFHPEDCVPVSYNNHLANDLGPDNWPI
jgi:hypothetical protein